MVRMARKLYIRTHGCQMNEYDSARLADLLAASHGLELTDRPEQADVLLLNTCSVRDKPQHKVYSELGVWNQFKQTRPGVVIGVGGCVASQEGEALTRRAPCVDLVFGPQTLHRLPQMLEALQRRRAPVVDVSFPEIEKFDALPPARVAGPRAFVSIMEGCSKYCTFCVVPYTRGEEFSRPFDDVLAEVVDLTERGVREVTLLGQNVNAWRGARHGGGHADLATLIEYLAELDGLERIRYTTSHPREMSAALIEVHGRVPKLASHLHLPVQSGSDRVLALMKRGYSALEYKAIVRRLRRARPDLALSSDFIVGFPGESDEDFEATMRLIEELRFDQSFSFLYSPRPGTPAAQLPDDTPHEIKQQRLQRLQRRLEAIAADHQRALVGRTETVLVEGPAARDPRELCGRTAGNHMVVFEGSAALVGRLAAVEITAALAHSLRGRLAARPAAA
jgi:tRNA-2-methylthio-N6-dimethylallyladenosine synthase